MNLPDLLIFSYLKENLCVLHRGRVYIAGQEGSADRLSFGDISLTLSRGLSLQWFEDEYFRINGSLLADLAAEQLQASLKPADAFLFDFVINQVIASYSTPDSTAHSTAYSTPDSTPSNRSGTTPCKDFVLRPPGFIAAIFESVLAYYGKLYDLAEGGNQLLIDGKGYELREAKTSLEGLSERYSARLEDHIIKAAGDCRQNIRIGSGVSAAASQGFYYDPEKKVGCEVKNGFFLYTIVDPYILYEPANGRYYGFPEAKIGIELCTREGIILWKDPVVINPYSHPSLHLRNGAYQRICNGSFSYTDLKKNYPDIITQLCRLISKSRDLMTRGYYGESGAWHSLEEPMFSGHLMRGNINLLKVTNT
ncbi:MAG: hypothetical protein ABH879_08640 [archaeon]